MALVLLYFLLYSLCDWSRKLAPLSQPIRFKTKTDCHLVACVFPRYKQLIHLCYVSSVIVQEERFQADEKVRRETRRIQALSMGEWICLFSVIFIITNCFPSLESFVAVIEIENATMFSLKCIPFFTLEHQ